MQRFQLPRRVGALAIVGAAVLASTAGVAWAVRPIMVSAPSISGVAMEGETLTANPGSYIGAEPPFSFEYLWTRCTPAGVDCLSLGVTGTTYTVTAADIGSRLRTFVHVTGQDCGEWRRDNGTRECRPATETLWSEQTAIIGANPALRPVNTRPPTITGEAEEGATLTTEDGGWTGPQPMTTARQWQRCDSGGNACAPIAGATAPTYKVLREDVQKTLRVVVVASNSRGTTGPVTSAPTAVVRAFLPRPGRTTISVGLVLLPDKLVIDRVEFAPAMLRSAVPATVRVRVSDTRGFRIRGAAVRVAGVPANLLAPTRDVRTGSDGWARVAVRPTSRVVFRRLGGIPLRIVAFSPVEGVEGDVAATRVARLPLGAPGRR